MPNRWLSLFRSAGAPPPKPAEGQTSFALRVDDRTIEVALRRHARARRYTLRIHPKGHGAVVTLPKRGSIAEAKTFVARHVDWLRERLAPAPAGLAPGSMVPIGGIAHRLVATGASRGLVRQLTVEGEPRLLVPGEPDHLERRVVDHLKRLARREFTAAVARHAEALGVRPAAIRIKDTTSRWGSATAAGVLSFSWRIVMAPPVVLDYLAAHEVAHLKEMNHSPRFWAHCHRLAPRAEEAKAWLKAHGRDLHRIG